MNPMNRSKPKQRTYSSEAMPTPFSTSGLRIASWCLALRFMQRLSLHIEGFALQRFPVDRHEATCVEDSAGLHHRVHPSFDVFESAVAIGGGLLGDDLATLVPHEEVFGEASRCLNLGAAQHHGLCILAPCNLAPLRLGLPRRLHDNRQHDCLDFSGQSHAVVAQSARTEG